MELRQLEAFVAVADELHFGRAAQRVQVGQPALSELIQRLERELGASLFARTTRRVALTSAGEELLPYARAILGQVGAATTAVRRLSAGTTGTVRLGITPPAAPILAPYLIQQFAERAPLVTVTVEQLWQPELTQLLGSGEVDVGITCGITLPQNGMTHEIFCAEPLLVALRPEHPLSGAASVSLTDLAGDTLGVTRASLFPAWTLSQRQALERAGVSPETVDLQDTDISARQWQAQDDVAWIMLIGSLAGGHDPANLTTVRPEQLVPFVLQWAPERAWNAAVVDFVDLALTVDPPPGWATGPAHRAVP